MKHDPYLIPGWPCEVWCNEINIKDVEKEMAYFVRYDCLNKPVFTDVWRNDQNLERIGTNHYDHYHPIGTEWDFIKNHPEQEKFVCSTVDQDGKLSIWDTIKIIGVYPVDNNIGVWRAYAQLGSNWTAVECGYCQDKTRYENGAWETSLREKPFWAGGEG